MAARFHVRLTIAGETHDEVKGDMDLEQLERQFLEPYRTGFPITINGRTVPLSTLERIRVSTSDWKLEDVIAVLKAEDQASDVLFLGGPGYEWQAADRAQDVTDQFITGPPGSAEAVTAATPAVAAAGVTSVTGPGDGKSVFVVAGRDQEAVGAVLAFLRALGLRVVEWEHAVARTGLPNPYVGDVVVVGLQMADAAVVLFTADDLVTLRPDLARDSDGREETEIAGQARPNVFYEAGIADTLGRGRTVLVEIGKVKSFSDAAGRHVVRYDGSSTLRNTLVERLRIAGLTPDTSGNAWLEVGDVTSAIESASAAVETARRDDS